MTNDNIDNRITEFKAKHEIMNISSNYSNVVKRTWRDKYVHELHAHGKNNTGYVNVGTIPQ